MGEEMAKRMPQEEREPFLAYWNTFVTEEQMQEIELAAKESIAKHLTTSELQVFVEFMEKPAGQSAMGKMKYYMADIMPLIQQKSMMALQQYKNKQ